MINYKKMVFVIVIFLYVLIYGVYQRVFWESQVLILALKRYNETGQGKIKDDETFCNFYKSDVLIFQSIVLYA